MTSTDIASDEAGCNPRRTVELHGEKFVIEFDPRTQTMTMTNPLGVADISLSDIGFTVATPTGEPSNKRPLGVAIDTAATRIINGDRPEWTPKAGYDSMVEFMESTA